MPFANEQERFLAFDQLPPDEQTAKLNSFKNPAKAIIFQDAYSSWKEKQPGFWESMLRGAGQGVSFGFSDELAGLAGAAGYKLAEPEGQSRPFWDVYKEAQQDAHKEDLAAKQSHGGAFLTGELGGGALTAVLGPAAAGLKGAAGLGAGYGAVAGAGYSDADLTSGNLEDWVTLAKDVGVSGTVGLVAGPVLQKGGELAGKGLSAVADKVKNVANRTAYKAFSPPAKSYRVTSPERQAEIGGLLLDEPGVRLFGNTTEGLEKQVKPIRQSVGAEKGEAVTEIQGLADSSGHKAAYANEVADHLEQKLLPKYEGVDADLATTIKKDIDALRNLGDEQGGLSFPKLEEQQLKLERKGRWDQATPSRVTNAHNDLASELNNVIEQEMAKTAAGAGKPESFEHLMDLKSRYAALRPAEQMAADASARGMARKLGIPLTDFMAGVGAFAQTGDPLKALGAAGLTHLALSRGRGTSASLLNVWSKALELLAPEMGKAALGAGTQLDTELGISP